jgi:hypothetical protein
MISSGALPPDFFSHREGAAVDNGAPNGGKPGGSELVDVLPGNHAEVIRLADIGLGGEGAY